MSSNSRFKSSFLFAVLGVTCLPLSVSGQQRSNPPDKTKVSRPPDRRDDPAYLDKQIRHISDAALFAAMDLVRPGLEAVNAAVSQADYPSAYRAWARYWVARPGFSYLRRPFRRGESGQARPEGDQDRNPWAPFYTVEEARKAIAGDICSARWGPNPRSTTGGPGTLDAGILVEGGRTFRRPDILWVAANI